VVGYSRLAGSDEERTLARPRALRSDLIDPPIAVHNGRVVKRTGDGSIIEFRSAVDAVRCAIEVQNGMVERNAGAARSLRESLRKLLKQRARTEALVRAERRKLSRLAAGSGITVPVGRCRH
jgi:class 3 adenylate cyclase